MPELPEVETVARYLKPVIAGEVINSIVPADQYRRAIEAVDPALLRERVIGYPILDVGRRAKLVLFHLPHAVIAVHLRMTGRLTPALSSPEDARYVTATFEFRSGRRLYFRDVRKFGRIYLFPSLDALDALYGIEPLSDAFTVERLTELLRSAKRRIKPLLLDQTVIAGLGNIYVDEALWAAKIHPCTPAHEVSSPKRRTLHAAIREILQASIERSGTTFQTFAFGEDRSGEFVDLLKVFGKEGRECPRCRGEITKLRVMQRGTHVCARCQRR